MTDNSTLVAISAFSALAGAILTQLLSGVFTYLSDQRKFKQELNRLYRDKQVEVAEQFYFVTGETMSRLKKSIEHWKDRGKDRSEVSIEFSNKEIKKLDAYMDKLNAENWKHNLIDLYFDVNLSRTELITANAHSHTLFLNLLDTVDRYKKAEGEAKEELKSQYYLGIFDLCALYDAIYKLLDSDMKMVKSALSNSFDL